MQDPFRIVLAALAWRSIFIGDMGKRCMAAARRGPVQQVALVIVFIGLAGCADGPTTHLPASGVTGSNGGSGETLHHENGHPRFL